MARILSQIATVIRGSIGGITFSADRSNAITARARTGPKRIMTNLQVLTRTIMTACISLWNGLTDSERSQWNSYALSVTFTGPFGDYHITGLQMFIRCVSPVLYMNIQLGAGLTETFTWSGPVMAGEPNVGPISASSLVSVGTGIAFTVQNNNAVDAEILYKVSPPYTKARNKCPRVWDNSLTGNFTATSGLGTLNEVLNLVEGAIYFVSIRPVQIYDAVSGFPPIADIETILRIEAETVAV